MIILAHLREHTFDKGSSSSERARAKIVKPLTTKNGYKYFRQMRTSIIHSVNSYPLSNRELRELMITERSDGERERRDALLVLAASSAR